MNLLIFEWFLVDIFNENVQYYKYNASIKLRVGFFSKSRLVSCLVCNFMSIMRICAIGATSH